MRNLVVALVALCVASTAHGFALRVAGFNPQAACTGCVRTTEVPISTGPIDVMVMPSTGGVTVGVVVMPTSTTGALRFKLGETRLAVGDGNTKFCSRICAGVVKIGQNLDQLNLTACTLVSSDDASLQWQNFSADFTPIGLTPRDTTGTSCTAPAGANDCTGGQLYIGAVRMAVGSCTGGSTDDAGFTSLEVTPD